MWIQKIYLSRLPLVSARIEVHSRSRRGGMRILVFWTYEPGQIGRLRPDLRLDEPDLPPSLDLTDIFLVRFEDIFEIHPGRLAKLLDLPKLEEAVLVKIQTYLKGEI